MSDLIQAANKAVNSIELLVRTFSIETLQSFNNESTFKAQPNGTILDTNSHNMIVNLISCDFARFMFAVYFNNEDIKLLNLTTNQSPAGTNDQNNSLKFAKDYTILNCKRIQSLLKKNGLSSGMSLPIHMRGFDQFFFDNPDEKFYFERRWKIFDSSRLDLAGLSIGFFIRILNISEFSNLEFENCRDTTIDMN